MISLRRRCSAILALALAAASFGQAAAVPPLVQTDARKKLVLLIAEPEYSTARTLPKFAEQFLRKEFRVVVVSGTGGDTETAFDHIEEISDADILLVSVRRRPPPIGQLAVIRAHVQAGKPVVGIRTASHAFSLGANQKLIPGTREWREWDAEVWGGHYANHFPNEKHPVITVAPGDSPLLRGVTLPFVSEGSLYKTSPLATGTAVLVFGTIDGQPTEPAAWTFVRRDGGRSFYTSLGHSADFDQPAFQHLLLNGIRWAARLP